MGYTTVDARCALVATAALALTVGGVHLAFAGELPSGEGDDAFSVEESFQGTETDPTAALESGEGTAGDPLDEGAVLDGEDPMTGGVQADEVRLEPDSEDGLISGADSVPIDNASPESEGQMGLAPCPGADGPYSASDASSAADVSMLDFLTPEEYENAFLATLDGDGSATFASLLAFAEQYIGLPYVWGGKDVNTQGGFDCSGFAAHVMNSVCGAGIDAWNTNAAMMYTDHCYPVSRDEARPGDLVFFTGTYGGLDYISHVGVYCGNGIMIDAGNPIGYHYIDLIHKADGVTKAGILFGRVRGTDITTGSVADLETLGRLRVGDAWYSGSPVEPEPVVVAAGLGLRRDVDYTVSYYNNVGVGTATVVVTGIGSYTGSLSATFDIVDPDQSLDDGVYTITSSAGALVMDVMNGSTAAGGEVGLFARHGGDNQAFRVTRLSNGYYSIVNVKSGLPLSHATNVSNLFEGVIVTQEFPLDTRARQWMIKPSAYGYVISSAWDSSMVASFEGPCQSEALITMQASTGAASQSWSFSPAGAAETPGIDDWHVENGQTYYYKGGALVTGEREVGGHWYYFDPTKGGAMARGFIQLEGAYLDNGPKTVYYDSEGRMAHDERQIDGAWYHFDPDSGAMARGFLTLTGAYLDGGPKTVYYDADGKMVHGECQIGGAWYYFDHSTGAMTRGFVRLNGAYLAAGPKTVYYGTDGRMVYGEQQVGGSWYYFDPSSGAMATGFVTLDGSYLHGGAKTVFYDSSGRMAHGERSINGRTYYFDPITGALRP